MICFLFYSTTNVNYLSSLSTLETDYKRYLEDLKKLVLDPTEPSTGCFQSALAGIKALHSNKISPAILSQDPELIFRVFHGCLESQIFDLYDEYAEAAGKIQRSMKRSNVCREFA